jgi:flagellin-like hook-associated protein FlgL
MSDISLSKAVRSNLLSLQNTASMMSKTQERLATGNKVNSALDNPSNFFTASSLNARAGDMGSLLDSMASGVKTIEAASNGLTSLTKTVESMQSTLRQARQDKSFQSATYEVTQDSTISVSGGQFGESQAISLQTQTAGTSAGVTGQVAYNGPTLAADANTVGEGAGARATISLNAVTDLAGATIKVDGKTVVMAAGSNTTALAAADLQSQLGTDDYKVGFDASKNIIIENIKTKGYQSASPVVDLGSTAATKASSSFVYNPSALGSSIKVDGTDVSVGGNAKDFAATLQSAMGSNYTVALDSSSNTISVSNNQPGAGNVAILGNGFNAGGTATKAAVTATFGTGGLLTSAQDITIGGVTKSFATGADVTDVVAAFNADTDFSSKFSLTESTATSGIITATAKNAGVGNVVVQSSVPSEITAATQTAETVALTKVAGVAGTTVKNNAAASDDITVVYGNKTANIKVTGQAVTTGGVTDRSEIAKSINDQLKAAGIEDVKASFDKNGNLSIAATTPEAKALTITGSDANTLFGTSTNKTGTGTASVSGYNSSGAVDQFVEQINRDASTAGKLRASNDNGKLRIENLSTKALDVSFDKDGSGVGAPTTSSVAGNSVRENLSKQFNDLRDQLDKLSDDASFNGINLLRGDELTITFNETGSSSIKIQAKDASGNQRAISAANLDITSVVGEDLDTDTGIDKLLGKLSGALGTLRSQASSFGSNLSSVQNRQDFTKNMINTLQTGAANLTLADTNEEAANLLALQTRQQLASSALSMASQADQAVLRLF